MLHIVVSVEDFVTNNTRTAWDQPWFGQETGSSTNGGFVPLDTLSVVSFLSFVNLCSCDSFLFLRVFFFTRTKLKFLEIFKWRICFLVFRFWQFIDFSISRLWSVSISFGFCSGGTCNHYGFPSILRVFFFLRFLGYFSFIGLHRRTALSSSYHTNVCLLQPSRTLSSLSSHHPTVCSTVIEQSSVVPTLGDNAANLSCLHTLMFEGKIESWVCSSDKML